MPSKSKKHKANTRAPTIKYTDAELAAAYSAIGKQFESLNIADTESSLFSSPPSAGNEIATKKDLLHSRPEDEQGHMVDPELDEKHQAEIRAFLRAADTLLGPRFEDRLGAIDSKTLFYHVKYNPTRLEYQGGKLFATIPRTFTSDPKDLPRLPAILSHLGGKLVMGLLSPLVKHVLKDFPITMTEMEVISVNERLTVICNMEMGEGIEPVYNRIHSLWKIKFNESGAEYSLDLSCEQFGRLSPAIKWDVYTALWCRAYREVPDGTAAARFFSPRNETPIEICQLRFAELAICMLEKWDETCASEKHADRIPLRKFLWLSDEPYEKQKAYFLSIFTSSMAIFHKEEDMNPRFSISKKQFLRNVTYHNNFGEGQSLEDDPDKAPNAATFEKKPRELPITEAEAFVRAAEILQEVWYIFCKNTYCHPITRIKRSPKDLPDNQIPTLEFLVPTNRSSGARQYHKLPSGINREEKHSILSHTESFTVIALFEPFVDHFLKDIAAEKTEVLVDTINTKLNVVISQLPKPEGWIDSPDKHYLWKVTLKDGLSYSLDLTSAQYGYSNSAIPWDEYTQTRCSGIKPLVDGYNFKSWMDVIRQPLLAFGFEYRVFYLQEIQEMITKWETDNKMEMKELFKLPATGFQKKKKKFLKLVRDRLGELGKTVNPTWNVLFQRLQDLRQNRATAEAKMQSSTLFTFFSQRLSSMGEEKVKAMVAVTGGYGQMGKVMGEVTGEVFEE